MLSFDIFLAFTGWETANKYKIMNTQGQQVYFAAEGNCHQVFTFMQIHGYSAVFLSLEEHKTCMHTYPTYTLTVYNIQPFYLAHLNPRSSELF